MREERMSNLRMYSTSPCPPPTHMVDTKTLWFGDVEPWMSEEYIIGLFEDGTAMQAKIIRDKLSGLPAGYGFVEFCDHLSAKNNLEKYNGQPIPNLVGKTFRLNWASYGINEKRPEQIAGPEYSIFVGDLGPEVNDYSLQQTFAPHYPSVRSAKVVTEPFNGQSRGYGFVRFGSEEEAKRAITEMNGQLCGNRPMRISQATPKRSAHQQYIQTPVAGDSDSSNTTIFVGGLDSEVTEDQLGAAFSAYGDLVYVKIPYGKGCGFVQFTNRMSAEHALQELHGTYIGRNRIRLSWGRSAQARQASPPSAHPSGGVSGMSIPLYSMSAYNGQVGNHASISELTTKIVATSVPAMNGSFSYNGNNNYYIPATRNGMDGFSTPLHSSDVLREGNSNNNHSNNYSMNPSRLSHLILGMEQRPREQLLNAPQFLNGSITKQITPHPPIVSSAQFNSSPWTTNDPLLFSAEMPVAAPAAGASSRLIPFVEWDENLAYRESSDGSDLGETSDSKVRLYERRANLNLFDVGPLL